MPQTHVALRLLTLATLQALFWSSPAVALDPSLDVRQYGHTARSFRDGFLNGAVYAFAQTPDGYLWMGTPSGVIRFDGVRAAPLRLPPGQRLPSTAVWSLLAARDGTLWIGTLDGLASWKNGVLTQYPALAGSFVDAILEDREGTVWAGALGHMAAKLCAIRNGSTDCSGSDGSLGAGVTSLYEDPDRTLWVGASTGLWRWKPGPPRRWAPEPVTDRQSLARGDDRSAVIVATQNVRQVVGTNVMDYPLDGVPPALTASNVFRDRNGGLWIGTRAHGLVHSYRGKTSIITHNDGLSSDQVFAVFEDREGTIWVATDDGLDRFRESPVSSLSEWQALSSAPPTSILAARDRAIWIGTMNGLKRWKDGQMTVYRTRSNPVLPGDSIGSLFEDERGRIWVSGDRGLAAFEQGRFTAVPAVAAGIDNAIVGDNQGGLWLSLWLTANGYGLAHLVAGNIVEHISWEAVGGGPGSGLVADQHGGIWTGLITGGIAHFRGGHVEQLRLNQRQASEPRVMNLFPGHNGAIWAATEEGIAHITNARVAMLTTGNGLPCNAIHWIMEDDLSSYWLYTRCGLLRIPRTELDAWTSDPKRTVHPTVFESGDGIQIIAVPSASRLAVTKSSDGRIWFLNGHLVSVIDPSQTAVNKIAPPVHIEQITADGKSYDPKPALGLPPRIRDVSIDYTALSLIAPEKVHFKYKLEGQDLDWREVVNERVVQYSNLPPRHYRFRVRASNNSGVWNETGDSLEFSVAPAYYQTTWFRVLLAATFLSLLWAAYQLRVRHLRQEERKLRDVIETMPTFAWTALPDGSVDFVNRRCQEYTGLSVQNIAGSGWESAVHASDLQRYTEKWRASVATGEPLEDELRLRRAADGQYRWFLTRAVALRDARGKVLKWFGISTEIEDRKLAEQERETLRADLAHVNRVDMLGELAASLSHELKQPIAAAITNARTALRWLNREKPDIEEACQAANRMVDSGTRSAEIIDRLRSLYKKSTPQRELVDVNETVRDMVVLLRSEANRYAVSMRTDLAADALKISADRVQLQQVLMNLMLNAIEAMKETGGILTVKSQAGANGELLISVSDTGVGLPAEKGDEIFSAFFTTKPQGSGMGLAISRSIIESHGGRLWATPNPGRGATFHLTLPATVEAHT